MPISLDDQARLPPLIPYDEVVERQRLADLRAFRKYLVDTGTVKCLVKLYQHIAKHEMRMDNPTLVKDFLSACAAREEEAEEIDRLERENATLREYNMALEQQAEELERELDAQSRFVFARSLWDQLTLSEFWEGVGVDGLGDTGMTVGQVFQRLCGAKVDTATRTVLVDRLRPPSLDTEALAVMLLPGDFCEWLAGAAPEELRAWCSEDLMSRLQSTPIATEPPYEAELLQAIRDTGLYPDHLEEIEELVALEEGLVVFMEALVRHFGAKGA